MNLLFSLRVNRCVRCASFVRKTQKNIFLQLKRASGSNDCPVPENRKPETGNRKESQRPQRTFKVHRAPKPSVT